MRFSATATASILFSLLALEAVGAPAPQYDTTIIVSTTVDLAAGSAIDTSSPSAAAAASAETSVQACKAKLERAQAWGQHRRPRPPTAGGAASSQEIPSAGSDTPAVPSSEAAAPSIIPITSVVETEPSPVESQMPSVVETATAVTPTAIEAGGDGEVVQSPPSQVAQPSVVEVSSAFSSSYSYESSSSSSWSSSAQPAPSAGSGGGAPAGFEADILNAHNTFRATWGMCLASVRMLLMIRCRRSGLEPDFGLFGKRILQDQELRYEPLVCHRRPIEQDTADDISGMAPGENL
jgi:hypothetical protein